MTRRIDRPLAVTVRSAVLAAIVLVTACSAAPDRTTTLTLVAYDSFILPDDAFAAFTDETGIRVDIALGGDAGEIAAKASLTSGNPEGDVLWGVDNTLLSRVVEAEVFEPYVSDASGDASVEVDIPRRLIDSAGSAATPVDFGYVCVNYDIEALRELGVPPPEDLQDLIRPEYSGLLVVPDATSSSPGLAFLLATRAAFGQEWVRYWEALVDNGVDFAQGWTDAYYTRFTRHGGDRPLVVSYSTSPPAEVLLADPPMALGSPAPTGVAAGTCFEQIEYAGVLRGTEHGREARLLVDYLVGREFQELLPENLFVYPANQLAELPESFELYTAPVSDPLTMTPDEIAGLRVELLDEWSRITGI